MTGGLQADRVRWAKFNPHAPDTCPECGDDYAILRFSGGNHGRRRYRESGGVECVGCGNREKWTYDSLNAED